MLTRSKAKHPPSKTVAEQRRIKDKVEKSNKSRRIEHMTKVMTIIQKLTADLPKMEAFIRELDVEAAINGTGTEEMQLSGTSILVAAATERETEGEDYSTALREEIRTSSVLTPADYGSSYPTHLDAEADHDITVESIQTTATEKGISFADALRESDVEPERDLPWAGAKRPLPERTEEEQAELERAINERMERQKENYLD
jgi:hypothetical protein